MLRTALVSLVLSAAALRAQLPEVHVIATGGTISNAGAGPRRTIEELIAGLPGLDGVARVTVEQFSNKGSGNITADDWRQIAASVNALFRARPGLAGVVVTHGTDTMEETAFFLDLTVGGCRPVVVTGSMRRPIDAGADGPANLRNAIRAAAAPQSRARGTMLLMNDELFAAREVTKANTSRLDAFAAPGAGPLGVTDPDSVAYQRPATTCAETPRFDLDRLGPLPRVDVLASHIGADSVLVDAAVAAGARGLVIESVGRGGMPASQQAATRRAALRGVAIVVSSRTGSGRVPLAAGADRDASLPMTGAEDLSPEKARVLLMLVLASGGDVKREFGRR